MPDWRSTVRDRIGSLHLQPAAESDLAEELAQHLEDRYRELCSGGADEREAHRQVVAELNDLYPLRAGLDASRRMPRNEVDPRRLLGPTGILYRCNREHA